MEVGNQGTQHFFKKQKIIKIFNKDRESLKKTLDELVLFIAIITPIMTLPQIWEIWVNANASGISLLTWFAYLISAIFWLIYGIVHKVKPIILTNILWVIFEIILIVGVFIFR